MRIKMPAVRIAQGKLHRNKKYTEKNQCKKYLKSWKKNYVNPRG